MKTNFFFNWKYLWNVIFYLYQHDLVNKCWIWAVASVNPLDFTACERFWKFAKHAYQLYKVFRSN